MDESFTDDILINSNDFTDELSDILPDEHFLNSHFEEETPLEHLTSENPLKLIYPTLACKCSKPLPQVAQLVGQSLYHQECLICSKCQKQINSTSCYIDGFSNLICNACYEKTKIGMTNCPICNESIINLHEAKMLKMNLYVHMKCLHCAQCNRTSKDVDKFSFCNGIILCVHCYAINNQKPIPPSEKTFYGKFCPAAIPETFQNTCPSCGKPFRNKIFICSMQRIMCLSCGLTTLINGLQHKK